MGRHFFSWLCYLRHNWNTCACEMRNRPNIIHSRPTPLWFFRNSRNTTFTPSAEFTIGGTIGAFVGGANSTLTLATNGVSLTKLAQIAANTILGNTTGATGNVTAIATSSLFTWTGTGDVVRATSPTLVTPALGTHSALVLTNATGLPVAGGGTGAATLTGLLQGNGTSAITGITGTAGQFPYYNGTN